MWNFASNVSLVTYTVLTFGDAQGDDDENSLPHMDHGFHSKLPPGILPHGLPTVQEVAPAITPQEKKSKEDEKKPSELRNMNYLCGILWLKLSFSMEFSVVELSEEQKQMIILSENFQKFVMKTGRIMERALWETEDIYADYIGGSEVDETT